MAVHEGIADHITRFQLADMIEPYRSHILKVINTIPSNFDNKVYESYYDWKHARSGFGAYKAVFVWQTLLKSGEGDVVVWADSRTRIQRKSFKNDTIAMMNGNPNFTPIILDDTGWYQNCVCSPFTLNILNANGDPKVPLIPQWSAHGMVFKNTPQVRDIVKQWVDFQFDNGSTRIFADIRLMKDLDLASASASCGPGGRWQYQGQRFEQCVLTHALHINKAKPIKFFREYLLHYRDVSDPTVFGGNISTSDPSFHLITYLGDIAVSRGEDRHKATRNTGGMTWEKDENNSNTSTIEESSSFEAHRGVAFIEAHRNRGIFDSITVFSLSDAVEPHQSHIRRAIRHVPDLSLFTSRNDWQIARSGSGAHKAVLIWQTLLKVKEGDVVVWADLESRVWRSSFRRNVLDCFRSNKDRIHIIAHNTNWPQNCVCSPLTLNVLDARDPKLLLRKQFGTYGIVLRNTPLVRKVVKDWLDLQYDGGAIRIFSDIRTLKDFHHGINATCGLGGSMKYQGQRFDQCLFTHALAVNGVDPIVMGKIDEQSLIVHQVHTKSLLRRGGRRKYSLGADAVGSGVPLGSDG